VDAPSRFLAAVASDSMMPSFLFSLGARGVAWHEAAENLAELAAAVPG